MRKPQENVLTISYNKLLTKDTYVICGRELVSTFKRGHTQPISFSFPNFISHPNDKLLKIFDQPREKTHMNSTEFLGTAEEML